MGEYWLEIVGIVVLVLVSGYFAAAEIALISASRPLLRARAEEGDKGAQTALRLLEDPSRLLAAVQVGITLVSLLASAVAAASISAVLARWLVSIGVPAGIASGAAVLIPTLAVAYVSLVFGELTPKRLGLQRAESVSVAVSRPIMYLATAFAPFVWLLSRSTDVVGRVIGLGRGGKPGVTEEELKLLVVEQGTLLDEEKRMIQEVFELGDTSVRELMVPRVDAEMIESSTPLNKALDVFQRTGFSRMPVYRGDRDKVTGILLLKDALPCVVGGGMCRDVGELARPAMFVPETKHAIDLLKEMQATRTQMAIVVDEHGGTEGLITLEDIIEEIVGEVSDEYDRVERYVTTLSDGDSLVDGRLPIEEANEKLGMGLPESDEYDTLAGWVLAQMGHIPVVGETATHDGWTVRVANVRRRRVARLRVTAPSRSEDSGADGAAEQEEG